MSTAPQTQTFGIVENKHNGWASFQKWLKKWNKIMAIIFSALVIIFLLSMVIVNALDAHEDAMLDMQNNRHAYTSAASCFWDLDLSSCQIDCMSGDHDKISDKLDEMWTEREECHEMGVMLKLQSSINFPKATIGPRWFTAKIVVNELQINILNIETIEPNAFEADALVTVKTLTIQNLGVKVLKNETFNGLERLEAIIFTTAHIKVLESNVLGCLNKSLKFFSLTNSMKSNPSRIDGFTGGSIMKALKTVKFNYNLNDTITSRTFVGLTDVITLDLSDCQIEVIGMRSFDPMMKTIKILQLQHNKLKTLPADIFDKILTSVGVQITMNNNLWHCDCDLVTLQDYLNNFSNFGGTIVCSTPISIKDYPVKSTDFCYIEDPPTSEPIPTTTVSQSTWEAEPTTETTTIDPNLLTHDCYTQNNEEIYEEIKIKKPEQYFKISNTSIYGEAIVKLEKPLDNFVLIWFAASTVLVNQSTITYSNYPENFNCLSSKSKNLKVSNLHANIGYTFCLLDSSNGTVSPLNCISYFIDPIDERHQFDDYFSNVWLYDTDKLLVITIVVVGLVLSIVLGILLSYVMMKCCPYVSLLFSKNLSTSDSADATYFERKYVRSHSEVSIRSEKPAHKDDCDNNSCCPPSQFDIVQLKLNKQKAIDQFHNGNSRRSAGFLQPPLPTLNIILDDKLYAVSNGLDEHNHNSYYSIIDLK